MTDTHKTNTGDQAKRRAPNTRTGRRPNASARPNNNNKRRAPMPQRRRPTKRVFPPKKDKIPDLKPDTVRVLTLGGVEEIGRNMTAIEFNDEIFVVDAGFMFEDADKPGIDYILPNTEYLEDRKHKIKALLITHGHLDHIGAIPFIIDRIGNPPIYTTILTATMIKKRQAEFPHLPELDIRIVNGDERIKIGNLPIEFFRTTHTIPDSMGVNVITPYGGIVITGDIKLDHDGTGIVEQHEFESFKSVREQDILLLLMDSTNIWKPGWSIPEHKVFETFEGIIKDAQHRLIIGTFASQLERVLKIIEIAENNNKKVIIEGRSMKNNIGMAQELGLIKTKPETLISLDQMADYPESEILILATGAQGDEYAALMRMSNSSHKFIKLNPKDTIVLSSSVIPGNEQSVQRLKDNISRHGVHIVTYNTSDVHASGHGNAEEARWIHQQIKPKFFEPHHGFHYMLRVHADLMHDATGLPMEKIIVPDNGTIVEISEKGTKIRKLKEKAPHANRVVEGFHVRDIQNVVMDDRKLLATDGIFMVVATVNMRTGRLRKSPDIISRGFIYLRESQDLLQQSRLLVKKIIEEAFAKSHTVDADEVKKEITKTLAKFLLQQTHKNPIVIPVIVGV